MRYICLPVLAILLIWVYGCVEEETRDSGAAADRKSGAEEHEPVITEDKTGEREDTGPIDIELGEYISEDGKVTVDIQDFRHDDRIPEAVSAFFSQEDETRDELVDNGKGTASDVFFESSRIRLQEDDVYYLALFMVIKNIEEGFVKIPHGFNGEQPVLLTREGDAHERIITQFKYAGPSEAYSGSNDLPPGSEGVIVFAYPAEKTPEEVHYIYLLEDNDGRWAEKGNITIPLNSLTNN